jgi:hypothetical protein
MRLNEMVASVRQPCGQAVWAGLLVTKFAADIRALEQVARDGRPDPAPIPEGRLGAADDLGGDDFGDALDTGRNLYHRGDAYVLQAFLCDISQSRLRL